MVHNDGILVDSAPYCSTSSLEPSDFFNAVARPALGSLDCSTFHSLQDYNCSSSATSSHHQFTSFLPPVHIFSTTSSHLFYHQFTSFLPVYFFPTSLLLSYQFTSFLPVHFPSNHLGSSPRATTNHPDCPLHNQHPASYISRILTNKIHDDERINFRIFCRSHQRVYCKIEKTLIVVIGQ